MCDAGAEDRVRGGGGRRGLGPECGRGDARSAYVPGGYGRGVGGRVRPLLGKHRRARGVVAESTGGPAFPKASLVTAALEPQPTLF